MESRLDDLDKKIKDAETREQSRNMSGKSPLSSHAVSRADASGMRVGLELVVSMGLGGAIGYGLDQWLGTLPLFMIIMFLLGTAAGFMNIYRMTQGAGYGIGYANIKDKDNNKDNVDKKEE